MRQFILIMFVMQFFLQCNAQPKKCPSVFNAQNASVLDTIKAHFPGIKDIPEKYKAPLLLTLSYFPELRECNIIFKYTRIGTTVNVRPSFSTILLRTKYHRKYIVRINNASKDSIITLDEVPYEAMIGLFGHEFSHIADYIRKNKWGIINRANSYLYKNQKERYEKEIDSLAIMRGLGCPLYQWSVFVLYQSDATARYKRFKRDIYLEPEEIEKCMNDINKR